MNTPHICKYCGFEIGEAHGGLGPATGGTEFFHNGCDKLKSRAELAEKENEALKDKFEQAHTMKAEYQAETWTLKDENERLSLRATRYEKALKDTIALNEMIDGRNKTFHTQMTACTYCETQRIAKEALEGKEPKS